MTIKNLISKIWKDPVGSKVIANAIWILPASITTVISLFKRGLSFLFVLIPIYVFIIVVTILLIIVTRLILLNRHYKELLIDYENKMSNVLAENNMLKLKPISERYNSFKVGDIVKSRLDNNMTSPVAFTVIDKTTNEIVCVDKDNNKLFFSPDSLSTADEFEKQKSDYSMMLATLWARKRS